MAHHENHHCKRLLMGSLLALAATTVYAQTGNITGTVLDASGGAVAGAAVTAKQVETAVTRTSVTDAAGFYSVPNLKAGHYDVTVEKPGFSTVRFQNVALTVAQNLTLNGRMEVGTVSQSVDVVAGASVPTIDMEDAQLSNVVDQRRIVDLPLITRDPYQLVLLSPGAQETTSSLGGFSVNGQRERNNNFLLDGTDNNDASVPGIPGGISTINPDSTQEFRVITNNYLPEFGRNSGAIIDVVTRSGSNQFHGDAYEFNRVNAMAARDYFNPTPDPQNPFVRNQFGFSLGGPIVKDKTFFFVNSEWDRFRTTLTNSATVPTAAFKSGIFNYTDQNGNTQLINLANPGSPNNALGLPLNPTMQKVLSLYPNPNGPAVDSIRGTYFFPTSEPQNTANTTFRIDHHFSDKYSVFARYIYNGLTVGNSLDEIFPGVGGVATGQQSQNGSFNFIAAFRPNLVNEFRFGLNRTDDLFTCNGQKTIDSNSTPDPFGFGTDYNFDLSTGVPTMANFGCGALGDSNGQFRRAGTWHYVDQLSWVAGKHNVKVGGEFRYVYDNGYDAFGARPVDDFTAFGNFGIQVVNCSICGSDETLQTLAAALLGVPGVQSQTQFYNAQGTRTATDFRRFVQHEYGLFVQDSWKVRPNLTIDLGFRYELDQPPFERNGNLSNLLYQQASDPAPLTFQTVGPGTGREVFYGNPYNFEPRLGLAWDPFHDGKTSVRAGYGIFHDRVFGNLFTNLKGNPPFVAGVQNFPNESFGPTVPIVTLAALPPPPTQPAPSSAVPDGSLLTGITILDPNLRVPYTQSWNAGIQRQLRSGMTIEVDYVGSGTHRMFRSVDGNPPLPWLVAAAHANGTLPLDVSGGSLRIAPLLGYPQVTGNTAFEEPVVIRSIGNATYNGLQTVFNKQFSRGVQFQAAYTWSHAIDDAADPLVAGQPGNRNIARNSFNLHEERGSSDYDLRHRLIVNYIFELPFGPGHSHLSHGFAAHVLGGWELSGLSTFQSGRPFDIYSARDSEYTGLSNRPDLVGDPSIPADAPRNQTGPPLSAFATQPFGRPGNLGRNTFTGPTYYNTDLNLVKNTHFGERINVQFRAEVYNVFNRIQFDQPGTSGDTLASPGTFGQSLSTITQPDGTTSARQIQLALKVLF